MKSMDTFSEIMKEENNARRDELEAITKRFEDIQIAQDRAREMARMSLNQLLPKLANCDVFDEWREHVVQQCRANHWTDDVRIIEMVPSALNGNARRAFNLLQPEQKRDLETMFDELKLQLNPQADANNRRRFLMSEKQPGESMSAFINRVRTYLGRFTENVALDPLAREILKEKVFSNLKGTERKILRTAVDPKDCTLETLVQKADMLLNESNEAVIGVIESKEKENLERFPKYNRGRGNRGAHRGDFDGHWGQPFPQWRPWVPQPQWGNWHGPGWGGNPNRWFPQRGRGQARPRGGAGGNGRGQGQGTANEEAKQFPKN
jgi:hypothetical protein